LHVTCARPAPPKGQQPIFQPVSPTPSSRGKCLYLKVSGLLKILTDIDVMPQECLDSLSFHASGAHGVTEHRAKMSKLGNHLLRSRSKQPDQHSLVSSVCCASVAV